VVCGFECYDTSSWECFGIISAATVMDPLHFVAALVLADFERARVEIHEESHTKIQTLAESAQKGARFCDLWNNPELFLLGGNKKELSSPRLTLRGASFGIHLICSRIFLLPRVIGKHFVNLMQI
jgi:hypothetical protein